MSCPLNRASLRVALATYRGQRLPGRTGLFLIMFSGSTQSHDLTLRYERTGHLSVCQAKRHSSSGASNSHSPRTEDGPGVLATGSPSLIGPPGVSSSVISLVWRDEVTGLQGLVGGSSVPAASRWEQSGMQAWTRDKAPSRWLSMGLRRNGTNDSTQVMGGGGR